MVTKSFIERQISNFFNELIKVYFRKNTDVSTIYKGKNVVHMGDSWIQLYGLAEGVAEKVGYTVTNCGFQATAISPYAELQTNGKKFSLVNLAKAIQSNGLDALDEFAGGSWMPSLNNIKAINWSTVDLLILSYGVNDYSAQNPLGDTTAKDEESVCGALKSAISIFQTINPQMEIVVTTPCYRYRSADTQAMTSLVDMTPLEEYRNAIGLTAMDCGVKLIDMRALSGINDSNHATTLLEDGLHPTSTGVSMWVNAFSKALETGFGGAFDVSNDFSFEPDNLCFDSEKLSKHKKWNATYTLDGTKYLCARGYQQYRDAILGMVHFDSLPVGTVISLNGYGRKSNSNAQRIGFYIKNASKSSNLLEKYNGSAFNESDSAISYSFTTTEAYTDCWVVFFIKQMTSWENGKALVRDMKCTVKLPS